MRYFQEYHDINIPNDYKTANGYNLGSWLQSNRKAYHLGKLSEERIGKSEKLGLSWDKREDEWKRAYFIAKCYQDEFHNLNELSTAYVFGEFNLGQWIRSQRRSYKNGKLSAEREALLKELGIVFE